MHKNLLTAPLDSITFEDVRAFCSLGLRESVALEYKREFSSKEPRKQIAKEIAAFANTHGGLLILGVGESADRLPEMEPQGHDLGNDPRDAIIQACYASILPPVLPEISEYLPNPSDPEKGFLVIRVAPSDAAPHVMDDGRSVYERVLDQSQAGPQFKTERATLDRIQHMLTRRDRNTSLQRQRAHLCTDRLTNAMRYVHGGLEMRPIVVATIGPALIEASTHLTDLRNAFSYPHSQPCITVNDGVYSLLRDGSEGWIADRFGNRAFGVVTRPNAVETVHPLSLEYFPWLKDLHRERRLSCLLLSDVLQPVVWVVDAAFAWAIQSEFHGNMRASLRIEGALQMPLSILGRGEYLIAASNRTDQNLAFDFEFSSSELRKDKGWEIAHQMTSRLLQGWGRCTENPFNTADALEAAEFLAFGAAPCPKAPNGERPGHHNRPQNHEYCSRCRGAL